MKFGDKLIKLRKKHNLSQEELANKLNVSRQSVSKWESNNTYPETDKIVQICNIFNCSMDALINENIEEIEEIESKGKNNINIVIDSFLEFITKTINMFSHMKISSILKCLLEQVIILVFLFLTGILISKLIPSIICDTISFIINDYYYNVFNVLQGICQLIWFILSIIILIHIFKLRYLNYYDEIITDVETDNKKEEIIKTEIKNNTTTKIVLRNPKKEPYAFLTFLSKIVIFILKVLISMLGLILIFTLILALIGLIISIYLTFFSKIFLGTSLTVVAIITINIILLLLITHFITNKKVKVEYYIYIIIVSSIISGIGLGLSIIEFKNIKIVEPNKENITENEISLLYRDNMIITNAYPHNYEFIIDDSIKSNDIIIKYEYDANYYNISYDIDYSYDMREYYIYLSDTNNYTKKIEMFINNLKKKEIVTLSREKYINSMKVIANNATVSKLINNLSKKYIFNQEKTNSGYKISNIEDRIEESELGDCTAHYNAYNDTVTCPKLCEAKKSNVNTSNGTITKYYCQSIENYNN